MIRTIVIGALVLAGCGWKSDGLARLEQEYPTPTAPPDSGTAGPIDIGTPQCQGFDGTWAVRLVESGTISPLGEPWKIVLDDLFLASVGGGQMDLQFCDQISTITTSSGTSDLGRAKVPDALKSALGQSPVTIGLPLDGTFHAENVVWLWGLHGLNDPLHDPLPTKDNYLGNPQLWDQDGDGNPGVTMTIIVPAGDRYMTRRAIWSFATGKLTLDNQWLTGALSAQIDESPLGATNDLLLTVAPITITASNTVYQLRCVGDTYSCASLSQDQAVLVKDAPK